MLLRAKRDEFILFPVLTSTSSAPFLQAQLDQFFKKYPNIACSIHIIAVPDIPFNESLANEEKHYFEFHEPRGGPKRNLFQNPINYSVIEALDMRHSLMKEILLKTHNDIMSFWMTENFIHQKFFDQNHQISKNLAK